MKSKHVYYVDIPDFKQDYCTHVHCMNWTNVSIFKTKREAIKFAKKKFGADKDGKISLISRVQDSESYNEFLRTHYRR